MMAAARSPTFSFSSFTASMVIEAVTIVSNQFLRADPFLKVLGAIAIFFMSFALVGLATGMGAMHPRFKAENLVQVAGSYGGIAFMVLAVLFILVETALLAWPSSIYLWHHFRGLPLPPARMWLIGLCFAAAAALSVTVFLTSMNRGVRALEDLDRPTS